MVSRAIAVNTATAAQHIGNTMRSGNNLWGQVHTLLLTPLKKRMGMFMESKVLVGKYNSDDVIYNSSSGGAFTVLYEYAVEHDFVVYGVRFDENFKVIHSRATTKGECENFRKSKYVLSNLNNSFQQVESDLSSNRNVLFSGSPCQCAGLLNYLKVKQVDITRLLVVDIICHGAPNQNIFDLYRLENEKRANDYWARFRFKGKYSQNGIVNSRSSEITYKSGVFKYNTRNNDPFLKGYYGRLFYRKSCAECPFAKPERISDITLGDAWGIEQSKPEWDSKKGISLILLNTEKAVQLIPVLYSKMELIESNIKWAIDNNSQLIKPTDMHKNRDIFFKLFPKIGLYAAVNRSMRIPFWKHVIRKIKCSQLRLSKHLF